MNLAFVCFWAAALAPAVFCFSSHHSRHENLSRESRIAPSRIAWSALLSVMSLGLAVLAGVGMVESEPVSALVSALVLAAVSVLALIPQTVVARFSLSSSHPALTGFILCMLAAACGVLALELPSNHEIWSMYLPHLLLEFGLVAAALLFLVSACRGHGLPAALALLVLAGVGLAQFFVITFKSMPIQPGDVLALSTAATVAGSYHYVLSPFCLYGIASAAVAITLLSFIHPLAQLSPVAASQSGVDAEADSWESQYSSGSLQDEPTAAVAPSSTQESEAQTAHAEAHLHISDAASNTDDQDRSKPASGLLRTPLPRRTWLAAGALLAAQPFISYRDRLGVGLRAWMPLDSYYRQGFLPTFISSAQRLVPAKPAGYRRRSAEDLLERYARVYDESPALGAHPARARAATRFQELKPPVICIMNESFADLSIFDGLRCGYTGPKRFLDLPDALMSGVSYMSAFGAGTCNSEFEFLTGNTMAFLGAGSYPYLNYNLAPVENLARHFKNQGYRTVAMHPNHGSNWNRVNVFEDLGFDSFLTIKDFPGAPELCHKVTDAATYDACLRELETSKDPVFIHDVTMEGHAGYDTGLVPPEQRVNIRPQGVDFDHVTWADEYLALNEDSDKALDSLLARLKLMERPVVVVMYGDHQPFFTDAMNDAYFPGEDPAVHVERLYQTRYLVWANFDLEEAGLPEYPRDLDLDISSLGAMLMHRIGAPMSEYQKARLALRAELPVINVVGRQDADGTWRLPEQAGSSDDARQDYEFMQHRILFDHGGKVLATRHQAEANRLETHEGA